MKDLQNDPKFISRFKLNLENSILQFCRDFLTINYHILTEKYRNHTSL